jgi:hypothetical protein
VVVLERRRVTVDISVGAVVLFVVDIVLGREVVVSFLVMVVISGGVVVGLVEMVVTLVVTTGLLLVVDVRRVVDLLVDLLVDRLVDFVLLEVRVGLLVDVGFVWSLVGVGQWQNASRVSVVT